MTQLAGGAAGKVLSIGRERILRTLWADVGLQLSLLEFTLRIVLIVVRVALTERRLFPLLELCLDDLFIFFYLRLNDFGGSELFLKKIANNG